MIRAAYKDIIDAIVGIVASLAMFALFGVAIVLGYQLITGSTPEDDTVYVCTMDGDKMRCAKEEQ